MGFFPARIERRRYGIRLPVLVGWTHPYAPLGTPLIDRDAGAAVVAAWLDHVAGHQDLPSLVADAVLPTRGPVAEAFAAGAGAARRKEHPARRPSARPAGARRRTEATISTRHRRQEAQGAARQRQRLADTGAADDRQHLRSRRRGRCFRRLSRARSGRLERPRRHRGRATTPTLRAFVEKRGHRRSRATVRRRSTGLFVDTRADRRDADAAQRRHRLVLEDRLRRRLRARLAGRATSARRDARPARRRRALPAPIPAPPPIIR